jgi:1,4-dihydroxy-2-naphthoyl-CoA hydrolase
MSDNLADADPATGSQSTSDPLTSGTDLDAISRSTFIDRMGIVIVEASAQRLVATMPVEINTQPIGLLHGGASCVLAETAGSVAAQIHAGTLGKIAVGIEINATHHRSVGTGQVTGTARALQLGASLASYEIVIVDDADRRICTARLTCMLRAATRPPTT